MAPTRLVSSAVDVGGGADPVTLIPDIKFVIQNLEKTIAEVKTFWETEARDALTSGGVELQVHKTTSYQRRRRLFHVIHLTRLVPSQGDGDSEEPS